jgi:hypothetical protein
MPEIVADPLLPSCYTCFPGLESRDLNYLALIPFCLARAGASPREAPATHAAGLAASPIPDGACPILLPGR